MGPFGYPNLLVVVAFVFAAGALAQGTGPRPPNPLLQGAPQVPLLSNPAQDAYAECVRRKHDEMLRYGQATQVRDLIDHRERFAEMLRADPQMTKRYPGGIDQAIGEAFRSYRAAGGTASTPQAVQPGEPPCAPPVMAPPGSRAARAQQPSPITQSRSMPVPSGSLPAGSVPSSAGSIPSPAGSVPVPSGNAPNRNP